MTKFNDLGLSPRILPVLEALGYQDPTEIQQASIPVMLSGRDIIAQAQTGTGKTAAFALPILSNLDLKVKAPQALIITPTRELTIQVADAFKAYAKNFSGLKIATIYGGQAFRGQLTDLRTGAHIVVGTPGRLMDHLRRNSLNLDAIKTVVLDEADEMLKMGFIEAVEWIFEQIKHQHQTALFSATLPAPIKKIAQNYLHEPEKINITPKQKTTTNIEQSYIYASRKQKLDFLIRYLEMESIQASIIFTRTKNDTTELANILQSRGYRACALNGDMRQENREKVINQLRRETLDFIVATDVAARGIDVERISHVINYDIPFDTESYIHRIGRTGRAGRTGKALLFVSPREKRMLSNIERTLRCRINEIEPPTQAELNQKRTEKLQERIDSIIKDKKLKPYRRLVLDIFENSETDLVDIAAALAYMNLGHKPSPKALTPADDNEEPRKIIKRKKSKDGDRSKDRGRSKDKGKFKDKAKSKTKFKAKSKAKGKRDDNAKRPPRKRKVAG